MISEELRNLMKQEVVNATRLMSHSCDLTAAHLAQDYDEETFRTFHEAVQSFERMLRTYGEIETLFTKKQAAT